MCPLPAGSVPLAVSATSSGVTHSRLSTAVPTMQPRTELASVPRSHTSYPVGSQSCVFLRRHPILTLETGLLALRPCKCMCLSAFLGLSEMKTATNMIWCH